MDHQQLMKEARHMIIRNTTIKENIGPLTFKMTEKVILTKLIDDLRSKYTLQETMLIFDYIDVIQDTVLS